MSRYRIKRFAALTFTNPRTLQTVAQESSNTMKNLQAKLKNAFQGLANDTKILGKIRAAKPAPRVNPVSQSIHAKAPVQVPKLKSIGLKAGGTSISVTTTNK